MADHCLACGRAITTRATAPKIPLALSVEERAKLSERDLHAYYAKTSHLEDIEFFLRNARPDALAGTLRKDWLSLRARAPRLTKPATQKEYRLLLSRYFRRVDALEHPGVPLYAVAEDRTALTSAA